VLIPPLRSIIRAVYCNAVASGAVQWGLVHGANYTILWLSGDSQGAFEGPERDRACIGGMFEDFHLNMPPIINIFGRWAGDRIGY